MINTDASAIEARYAKQGTVIPRPQGEPPQIYAPGMNIPPEKGGQGQIPMGQPVPPGVVISQVVGRGQAAPSIAVVPPQQHQPNQPSMAVIPPTGSSRTTIGTFVETPQVSHTVSNPMTSAPPPVNSGTIDAPVLTAPPKAQKRKKVDLTQEILTHIWELGGEKGEEAQKFYDRSPSALQQWMKQPGRIPMEAVVKFLNKRPGVMEQIAEELEPHFAADGQNGSTQSLPNRGRMDVIVCAAILERPTLPFLWTMLYLAKKYELGFDVQADTMITRSRNMLAHRFLKTGAQWSLWIDSDVAAPIANADWFRWITGSQVVPDEACRYDVLGRLVGHNKAIIGGVYAARRFHGQLVIQPEIHPRHHEDKLLSNDIRKGTARGIVAVDWIGFGCALVHREVFLEIQRRFPDLAPQTEFSPWRFFDTQGDMGEDEAFCQRAQACSIPIWLDTQLICGHIGQMAFLPEHTQAVMAL
jgi:hypothetical protein